MARKSRNARRRAARDKRREPFTAPADPIVRTELVEVRLVDPADPPPPPPAAEPDADGYIDDLADTIGDKRPARTKAADRLNSATNPADHKVYEVRVPLRFSGWLERYAERHGTDVSGVLDFAMRQIWRDDPDRIASTGGAGSMRKADFDAMNQ